jgi:hypothetical protein
MEQAQLACCTLLASGSSSGSKSNSGSGSSCSSSSKSNSHGHRRQKPQPPQYWREELKASFDRLVDDKATVEDKQRLRSQLDGLHFPIPYELSPAVNQLPGRSWGLGKHLSKRDVVDGLTSRLKFVQKNRETALAEEKEHWDRYCKDLKADAETLLVPDLLPLNQQHKLIQLLAGRVCRQHPGAEHHWQISSFPVVLPIELWRAIIGHVALRRSRRSLVRSIEAIRWREGLSPAARPGEGGHGATGRGRGIEYAGGQPPPAPPPPSPPSSPPTEELEEEDMEQAQLAWNPRMEMVGARSEAQDPARLPSCLLAAAAHGDRAAVVAWLDGGGQVDAPCVLPDGSVRRESMLLEGLRMLTVASGNGHTQLVDVLLERKASVNLFDSQAQYYVGRGSPPHGSPTQGTTTTALMKAAQIGSASCVRRLLKAGACCNVLSLRGLRAHEVAAINGHCEVASIISQHISTLYINKHNAIVERELAEEALRRALEADELAALRTAVDAHAEAAGGKASAVLMLACERCDELVAEQRKARKQAEKKQRQEQKKREKEEATAKAKVEAEARAKAKAEAEEAMARQIQAEARAKAEAEARAKAEAARVKAEAARVKAAAEAAAAAAALEAAATAETAEAEDEEGGACAAEQATHLSQAIELRPAELRSATNSFAAASVIGRGAYGIVYVVTVLPSLPSSGAVAVKRLHNGGEGAQADLKREIDILSACHHAHTLPLLGYCFQSSCLVSPLCRGGSLEDRLFPSEEGSRRLAKLGFNTTPPLLLCFERVRIVCGAMRGLHYLHTCFAGGKPLVLHRDIKPANLLLSEQLDVYVADFGLAKGAPDQQGAAATPLSTVGVKGSASAAPGMTAPSHTLESTLTMCGCSLSLSLSRSICLHGPAVGAHGRPMLRADRQLCNGRDGTCGDARTACCWCAAALSPHVAHARRSGQVGGGHTARRECRRVAR